MYSRVKLATTPISDIKEPNLKFKQVITSQDFVPINIPLFELFTYVVTFPNLLEIEVDF